MGIQSVGIVGAGQMGNGIAHVFALAGYDVLLNDISQTSLDKAIATIDKNLERQASRGKITEEARAAAMAASVAPDTAIPTSACFKAGASLTPSPVAPTE